LGFQRVGTDHEDRVSDFVIGVAVVQFANAHVTRRVHFRVIRRAVVNARILDLHAVEVELAGGPGVLIAAGATAVVEHGHHQFVLAVFGDDFRGHARHKVQCVIPGGRLPHTVAPDHRIFQALLLSAGHARRAVFGHAATADRGQARVYHAVGVGDDGQMHVFAILRDHVVHRRSYPGAVGALLLGQVDAKGVAGRRSLLVARPSIGLVSAADDAVVAGDIVHLRIRGRDGKAIDLSLVSHVRSSLRARSTGDRRSGRCNLRRRCRPWRPRAGRIAAGSAWHGPRSPGHRPRRRNASSDRDS